MNLKLSTKTLSTNLTNGSSTQYGSNGLPATPNSISIIGNFKSKIEKIDNKYLVRYLDCYRNKDETITFVNEYYDQLDLLTIDNDLELDKLIYSLVNGLYYLHFELDTIHGFISPDTILKDNNNNFKLNDWPFNLVTLNGKLLDNVQCFLPKDLKFLSPERIIDPNFNATKKSDIWSLALTILYLIDNNIRLPKNPADFLLCKTSKDVLRILSTKKIPDKYENFFNSALEPLIDKRCSIDRLLELINKEIKLNLIENKCDNFKENDILNEITINELYYFWKLSKGNRKNKEFNDFKLSICNLPKLIKLNQLNYTIHNNDEQSTNKIFIQQQLTNEQIAFLPTTKQILELDDLITKLNSLDKKIFYPILFTKQQFNYKLNSNELIDNLEMDKESIFNLPLIIKENDFEYQIERTLLFKRLVNEQPFTKDRLKDESKIDIPPFYRGKIWSSLLSINNKELYLYRRIIKETNLNTDRQISVDIPRCHQYNELLSSPSGHLKLKRILKAWLKYNENKYVYWQGLDSLAAPFIMLNFDNEALAFASFNSFINKYLEGFFSKDNTTIIQEYLALFAHLIIYHDPQLFNHLQDLNFTPELYAIPWFLTMFTHVLPLYKIVHIWDTLILNDKSFPLFIGFSILKQLRNQLINYPFNDCILIFSDLPEINIEKCIENSKFYYEQTPSSLVQRNLITLNDLREEICPRIEIRELIEILSKDENNVLIIDGRNDEEINTLGKIRNSIQIDLKQQQNLNSIERIKKLDYEFIVVVGNYELAKLLVKNNIIRVCTLLGSSLPPNYYEL